MLVFQRVNDVWVLVLVTVYLDRDGLELFLDQLFDEHAHHFTYDELQLVTHFNIRECQEEVFVVCFGEKLMELTKNINDLITKLETEKEVTLAVLELVVAFGDPSQVKNIPDSFVNSLHLSITIRILHHFKTTIHHLLKDEERLFFSSV